MSLEKLMHNYADYNLWANKTLTNWLLLKPAVLLKQHVLSSFPSVVKTIAHLSDTEKFWLEVLKGSSSQAWKTFIGPDDEVIPGLIRQSEDLSHHIKSLDEAALLETCHLDTAWLKGYVPKYEMIQHCINHGTYHRGQIITIARNVTIADPPTTDYNYYNMVWRTIYSD